MTFFVGITPWQAKHFERAFVSVNELRRRVGDFEVGDWMMDSGAFSEIKFHGWFRDSPEEYAARINRWSSCGNLLAAVTQDVMCEPFVLAKTGLTYKRHQEITIERYDTVARLARPYVLPVLQGFQPHEYVEHLAMYGDRLPAGKWVGVGSVCKRNTDPGEIERVLLAIKWARPDLRLHGFGLKSTALKSDLVWSLLHSADSMAWSYAARKQGRDCHDWREARQYIERIHQDQPLQTCLFN